MYFASRITHLLTTPLKLRKSEQVSANIKSQRKRTYAIYIAIETELRTFYDMQKTILLS